MLALGGDRTMLVAVMAKHSDRIAFETLLRPHLPRLYRLACRLESQRTDADDLFQQVLIRAFERLDQVAALDDPGPWLARVLYNRFVDNGRRRARRRLRVTTAPAPDAIENHPGGALPDEVAAGGERAAALYRALAMLSDDHRVVLLLHDSEGYKLTEIQELTNTPVGTLKSRLHRARARLRALLDDDGTFSG